MKKVFDVVASIVTYNNDPEVLNNAIKSFLDTDLNVHILISDNSPSDQLKHKIVKDSRLTYFFNNKNLGFGKAHNICINKYAVISKYYLILNPDVYFSGSELEKLFNYLESNPEVGLVSPKIVYPDESIQYSCRMIPSPIDMLARRLPKGDLFFKKRISRHQFGTSSFSSVMEVPFLLGCFLLTRSSELLRVKGFDERYFMYMEDLDLCRKIGSKSRVSFYADAKIYHIYERASSKKPKLFFYHLNSMIMYFNKWGWVFDRERKDLNSKAKRLYGN